MPWFKVDDGFHSHPKVIDLSLEAIGAWTLAGAWCAQYLTDGHITPRQLAKAGGDQSHAAELVGAGLWHETEAGWQFANWSEYQPTKESVESKREAETSGAARGNHARWHVGRGVVSPDCEFCQSQSGRSPNPESGPRSGTRSGARSSPESGKGESSRPGPTRPDPEEEHVATSDEVDDDAPTIDPNDRDDVRAALDYLDEKIREVDPEAKLPSRTKANADAARLLIDKDGRTVDQIKAAADYALDTEFWRPNIRSMSKLRAKYETLRAQAQRDQKQGPRHASGPVTAQERRRQLGAERHERIVSGEFQPGRPPIDEDALWAPRQIEEA